MKKALEREELEKASLVQVESLYEGPIFALQREKIHYDKAAPPQIWDIVIHPGAVVIIPITDKGTLLLVEQWRRPIKKISLELPAGLTEKGETPLAAAQRELQEEIGFAAKELTPFGGMYTTPGFCTEYLHFFIGKQLIPSPLLPDLHEAIDVVELSLKKALDLIDTGHLDDAKTIAGILRYARAKTNA